jgi:hypothetical protein
MVNSERQKAGIFSGLISREKRLLISFEGPILRREVEACIPFTFYLLPSTVSNGQKKRTRIKIPSRFKSNIV